MEALEEPSSLATRAVSLVTFVAIAPWLPWVEANKEDSVVSPALATDAVSLATSAENAPWVVVNRNPEVWASPEPATSVVK